MNNLKISVVIATFNRAAVIGMVLDSFKGQTLDKVFFEVLVVDDGSTDNTREVVEKKIEEGGFNLRYLAHRNSGVGFSQNRGIKEAMGEIVLNSPDDIVASEALLSEHVKAHEENPEKNIAILGKVIQSDDLPNTHFLRNWDPFMYYKLEGKKEVEPVVFLACNISLKRTFMLENGLYRERTAVAHEDIELGYRLGTKGLRILYKPEALSYHYHVETLDRACKRAYERGWNFDLLSGNIPPYFIYQRYSLLAWEAGIISNLKVLPREILRWPIFNWLTVTFFWQPVLSKAQENKWAQLFANNKTYRGIVGYYMRKGLSDRKNKVKGSGKCV